MTYKSALQVDFDLARSAWIAAFHRAHHDLPAIGKDTAVTVKMKEGGTYSYKYAPLPEIIAKVAGILKSNGFSIAQDVTGDGATVAVSTRIYHKDGWVETFGPLALKVIGDAKAAGSAITYARRYALCAALGIAPDEDDDGEAASKPTDTPWTELFTKSRGLTEWTEAQRSQAFQIAVDALAITSGAEMTHEEADRIWSHLQGQYESRSEQETLGV